MSFRPARKRWQLPIAVACGGALLTSCATQAGGSSSQGPDGRSAESLAAVRSGGPQAPAVNPSAEGGAAQPAAGTRVDGATVNRPIPAGWTGKLITGAPTSRRVVALTIDCGGNRAGVSSILATLRQTNVHATFFVTGQFARAYPQAVRAMVADGHLVGNHSDTHPDFAHLSARAQAAQLRRAERSIAADTGSSPRPWFRFPYGSYDSAALRLVNREGYAAIGWTVDSLGWEGTSGGQSARTVKKRVLAAAQPGEIPLMHCGANPDDRSTLDASALPAVIRGLSGRGYSFATLGDVAR